MQTTETFVNLSVYRPLEFCSYFAAAGLCRLLNQRRENLGGMI